MKNLIFRSSENCEIKEKKEAKFSLKFQEICEKNLTIF